MLILTRKIEEKIKIGDDTVITILGIEGGSVKIGIDAPKAVTILRMEVIEQVQKENVDAVAKNTVDIARAAQLVKKKFFKE